MANLRRLLLLGFLALAVPAQAAAFRVVTEEWAPYNFQQDGQPAGFSVELLQAALKLLGEHPRIEFMPWNRAYKTALEQPDVLIFSIACTREREQLFKWVAPVLPRKMYLYRLASRQDIDLQSIEDAKRWQVGSNAEQDASTRDLLRLGFVQGKNLQLITGKDVQNLHKLQLGRIDLLASSQLQMAAAAREAGYPLMDFVPTLLLSGEGEDYYFAFSLGTPDSRVAALREAFERLHANGTYAALLEKYTR
ncbi:amino acid ABC transporter substrate-binding protein, PAAT family [Pseudomonas pohangensis]|uniref:Amino acid ABC transporter substrate-binding protein, PAAT family n=1 Tax=Pseudomonas pohangensis TaxID=364197 RepID=A0A1H2ERN6_9PSED|nr:transporter substrate-binding domain-containing protein [Pseudomonas pohangensis]SDT97398.1 amino acid ABC transporter substrate-binding protein, PAAT family [Pseudomonas pohangensis]